MTTTRTYLLAALGLVLAALIVGCGGSDDATDSSSPDSTSADSTSSTSLAPLTKVAFIKQADAICDKADDRQAANYKDFKTENGEAEGKADEEAVVTEVGLPAIELEVEELREIGAPEGDEDLVAGMIDEVDAAVEATKKKPLSVYKEAENPFKAPEEKAAKYGLKACGFT